MVAIKICGMRDSANIGMVAQYHPSYLGFICWPGSKRFVGESFQLDKGVDDFDKIKRVAVFVNQSIDVIEYWIERLNATIVQLHGDETPELCQQVKKLKGIDEVWKAIPVSDKYPSQTVASFENRVDRILFDTKSDQRGGSGVKFSWGILSSYESRTPFILSGGLKAEDLIALKELSITYPQLSVLDFNSGLEVSPGIKDQAKIIQLFK